MKKMLFLISVLIVYSTCVYAQEEIGKKIALRKEINKRVSAYWGDRRHFKNERMAIISIDSVREKMFSRMVSVSKKISEFFPRENDTIDPREEVKLKKNKMPLNPDTLTFLKKELRYIVKKLMQISPVYDILFSPWNDHELKMIFSLPEVDPTSKEWSSPWWIASPLYANFGWKDIFFFKNEVGRLFSLKEGYSVKDLYVLREKRIVGFRHDQIRFTDGYFCVVLGPGNLFWLFQHNCTEIPGGQSMLQQYDKIKTIK
jgi:hypothetical protein